MGDITKCLVTLTWRRIEFVPDSWIAMAPTKFSVEDSECCHEANAVEWPIRKYSHLIIVVCLPLTQADGKHTKKKERKQARLITNELNQAEAKLFCVTLCSQGGEVVVYELPIHFIHFFGNLSDESKDSFLSALSSLKTFPRILPFLHFPHWKLFRFKFVRAEEANGDEVVGYLGQQAAKIINWKNHEAMYGTAQMADRTAQGIDCSGERVEVSLYTGRPKSPWTNFLSYNCPENSTMFVWLWP